MRDAVYLSSYGCVSVCFITFFFSLRYKCEGHTVVAHIRTISGKSRVVIITIIITIAVATGEGGWWKLWGSAIDSKVVVVGHDAVLPMQRVGRLFVI